MYCKFLCILYHRPN